MALADRVEVLEQKVSELESVIRGLQQVKKPVEQAAQNQAEPAKVVTKAVGGEMSPSDYFGQNKVPPLNYGPVPLDGRGRLVDPSWRKNDEKEAYERLDDLGNVVETISFESMKQLSKG
jgi:hypothetical protein